MLKFYIKIGNKKLSKEKNFWCLIVIWIKYFVFIIKFSKVCCVWGVVSI